MKATTVLELTQILHPSKVGGLLTLELWCDNDSPTVQVTPQKARVRSLAPLQLVHVSSSIEDLFGQPFLAP
jgi:hypothetical protein